MKTRSLRLPDDLLAAVSVVEQTEHLDEAPAIRKLLRLGLETYVASLYGAGRLTLREAAERLALSLGDTIDILRERGVSGNLTATDVIESIERFGKALPEAPAEPNAWQLPEPRHLGGTDPFADPAWREHLHVDTDRAVAEAPGKYQAPERTT